MHMNQEDTKSDLSSVIETFESAGHEDNCDLLVKSTCRSFELIEPFLHATYVTFKLCYVFE
jgi:hypothetical protein